MILSQGPIILHIALYLTSFLTTEDEEPLICIDVFKNTQVATVSSQQNLELKTFRMLHLVSAILLFLAKVN